MPYPVGASGDQTGMAADEIVGYTCGTCCKGNTLTHETMSEHDPEGTTLCVHSVCVRGDKQRQGIALKMLKVDKPVTNHPHVSCCCMAEPVNVGFPSIIHAMLAP